ncbi:MAG TPA: PAS domain S-box protein [Polyangiaceae bacterium]|nr:PAS domain S-box protein [Polyangiaceae bacterium]
MAPNDAPPDPGDDDSPSSSVAAVMPFGDEARQLLDAAPDAMIVVGPDARIAFANARTEELFGYERDEIVGQPLDTIIPERFRASHVNYFARYAEKPSTRPMGASVDLYGRRKDGTEIPVEVSLSPVRASSGPAFCAAIRDISERKRIEAIAKLNADRLAGAVETIQDAFALFDADDKLVMCNSVYRGLIGEGLVGPILGKPYEELLDAWMSDLALGTDEERLQFRSERLASRSSPTASFDVRTRDGRSLRVTDRRGIDGGIVKTVWDLTDDVRLASELREARAAAEAASEAKSEFLSSMSHELRTPLNAILGFAQLLARDKKEPLSTRHRERVDQILRGGEHLLHLIDDILDLSRIEAGRVSISTEPVSVTEVLEHVKTTLDSVAARAGIRLEIVPPEPGFPLASADRTRFLQIVTNFTSNAIKYNRPGGSARLTSSRREPGRLRVSVADTGLGIPEDKQDKIFQPFQRAGQETGPIEGTGIGLVITKRLAELMGGRVGFTSAPGTGSEFWVELPTHVQAPEQRPLRAARTPGAALLEDPAARLVLYIEDNPANMNFMRDVLGDFERIELVTAPTAEMGIEIAAARRPDLVIMDINLPGISGFEALRRLRERSHTKEVPVIALSAAASERDKQRGLQAGFYRYLTKPVKLDELLEAFELLLLARD